MALLSIAGAAVIVAVNTVLAGVLIRFFRLRLDTDWGTAVYAVLFVPMALVVSTMLVGAVVPGSASPEFVVLVAIVLPLGLGAAIDFFWMPAPDEVELPDTT